MRPVAHLCAGHSRGALLGGGDVFRAAPLMTGAGSRLAGTPSGAYMTELIEGLVPGGGDSSVVRAPDS